MALNIFEKAAAKAPAKKTAAKTKLVIPVKVGNKITRLNKVREDLKNNEAEEASLLSDLKDVANEAYLKQYKEQGRKPENFVLQDEHGGKTLIIVQDKYTTVSDAAKQTIEENFGEKASEILTTETEYSFDPDLLKKHMTAIAKAIEKLNIPEADKENLIVAKVKTSVTKGIIDKLDEYEDSETLYSLIKPVIQFKNQE